MALGTVDWPAPADGLLPGRPRGRSCRATGRTPDVADEKAAHDKALDLFVYAPVGVALYVRDMLPTMMDIFVARREAGGGVAPPRGTPASAPPPARAAAAEPGRGPPQGRRGHRHRTRSPPRAGSVSPRASPRAASRSPRASPAPRCPGSARCAPPAVRAPRAGRGTDASRAAQPTDPTALASPSGRPPSVGAVAPGAAARAAPRVASGAGGRRPPDPRLRRAVGVAGGRAARGARPRVARLDPPLRGRAPRTQHDPRQDRSAHLRASAGGSAAAPRSRTTSRASSSWRA